MWVRQLLITFKDGNTQLLWFYCSSNTNWFHSWRKITVENIGFLRYFRSIFWVSVLIIEFTLFLKKLVDWFILWRFVLQRLHFFCRSATCPWMKQLSSLTLGMWPSSLETKMWLVLKCFKVTVLCRDCLVKLA